MRSRSIARPTTVPYVTIWDSELSGPESDLTVELSPVPRLAYKGLPRPADRDGSGVLWARVPYSAGIGRPRYDSMHPGRQYECMYTMKCQVCGQPASRNEDGWLFLDWRKPGDPPTWPEGSRTAMPPLCELHARKSVEQCPHLGEGGFAVLRVKAPRLWGHSGALYTLTAGGWRTHPDDVWLANNDPQRHGLLASKLIRELRRVTVADLP